MGDIDGKGITQLLLNPLYLMNFILGTVVPGALLIILLAFKGNLTLHTAWLSPLFGYKTKIAIFIFFAFVFGSMLRVIPFRLLGLLRLLLQKLLYPQTPAPEVVVEGILKGQPDAVRKMINSALTDGVLFARPALLDRLSLLQTDVAFHVGIGTTLIVCAFVPGDGSLRLLEGLLGIGMLWSGIRKGKDYAQEALGAVGIGLLNVFGSMTPHQITLAKAAITSLGLVVQTTTPVSPQPEPQGADTPVIQK
jgi:hypothetical protein